MFNWYEKLIYFLSPSIISGVGGMINTFQSDMTRPRANKKAPIPVNPAGTPRTTAYKINPYTALQLAQFNAPQQGLLSAQNPQYQQYLAKMAGYGAGAGKTQPAAIPTSGDK